MQSKIIINAKKEKKRTQEMQQTKPYSIQSANIELQQNRRMILIFDSFWQRNYLTKKPIGYQQAKHSGHFEPPPITEQ